jgi:hypothetical protein
MDRTREILGRLRARRFVVLAVFLGGCGFQEGRAGNQAAVVVDGSNALDRGENLEVWTADAAQRVQPTSAAGSGRTMVMEGPRAAYESYQVVVRARSDALEGVNLLASDLSDGRGHTIASSNVVLFREWFIDFAGVKAENGNRPAPTDSPTKDSRVPDPLIPLVNPYDGRPLGAPFTVHRGMNQPVWVDVYVPPNATPGTYTGTITITARGQEAVVVPMSMTVWDLLLPDQRAVPTFVQMDAEQLVNFHRDTWTCSGGSCYFEWLPQSHVVVRRYEELVHEHRLDVGQFFVPEPTGTGACSPPTGWTDYDKAIQPYMDGSYFADRVPSTRLQVPLTPGASYGTQTCTEQQYKAIAGAWATHLKEKGWFDRAIIFAEDEPPPELWPEIAKHGKWILDADPDWKPRIMGTIAAGPRQASLLDPVLGIYVDCLKCYDDWYTKREPPFGRKEWPERFRRGFRLWFYESNAQVAPYPTFASNTLDGNEPRMMMWGAWYEGATGFLYWQILQWNQRDSWGPNIDYGVTGDGVLVYPGHHDGLVRGAGSPPDVGLDGPIPSMRLKRVRSGLQDWALFTLAAGKGKGDYARSRIEQAYSQLGGCSWFGCRPLNGRFYWLSDEGTMNQIRRDIAMAIK